jgi:hypothetical protein
MISLTAIRPLASASGLAAGEIQRFAGSIGAGGDGMAAAGSSVRSVDPHEAAQRRASIRGGKAVGRLRQGACPGCRAGCCGRVSFYPRSARGK